MTTKNLTIFALLACIACIVGIVSANPRWGRENIREGGIGKFIKIIINQMKFI